MSDRTDLDIGAIRRRLEERLREIAAHESGDGRKADTAAVELDQSSVGRLSRMDAIQVQEMALAGKRRRLAELARIQAAVKRIDDGDYGFCVNCDEPIALKRLEVDPATPACIRCAGRGG